MQSFKKLLGKFPLTESDKDKLRAALIELKTKNMNRDKAVHYGLYAARMSSWEDGRKVYWWDFAVTGNRNAYPVTTCDIHTVGVEVPEDFEV